MRGADVFIVQPTCGNPDEGLSANDALMELLVMVDAAVGGSAHRVIAVDALVRLLAPGQEVGAARADQRAAGRADARGRRDRPDPDDGPALRPDPGLLPEALRPHDRAVHAHPVLRRPRARGPRRRRPGRRPREAEQAVRLEDRRRPGDPQQGAPRPAGRRDQLRDRRRRRQDRGDRRRHHRHRRHARRPPPRRSTTPARAASTRPPPTASSPATPGRTWPPPASSRSSSPTRSRCRPARRTTSACSPAPTC